MQKKTFLLSFGKTHISRTIITIQCLLYLSLEENIKAVNRIIFRNFFREVIRVIRVVIREVTNLLYKASHRITIQARTRVSNRCWNER